MISLIQNQANEELVSVLTAFNVFGNLIIQVVYEKKYTDFVHGFHGVDNTTVFILVSFLRNNNPKYL